ncbi:MAG: succinate dehydrogenase, hydrophobic membrane anchor protein [Thermodesulfovibrio sp.]|nr:succinate dehydrogenase, hydrophobic membrane anchor protein [Thermodesulfovibrio sp.]
MWSWLLHRITGVILVLGLLYHFIFMHFMGHDNYSYEAVMQRLREPSWKIFNLVFLFSALYHGFYGLNGLITEYVKGESFKKFFKLIILILPLALAIFGIKIVLF